MILDKLNFSIADKIIKRYAHLLMDLSIANPYHKYGYNAMQGYHVKDIMNSFCLMIAYQVYNTNIVNHENRIELKSFADQNDSSIIQYFTHFIPDETKIILDKLNKTSTDFSQNLRTVISDFQDSDEWKIIKEAESVSSFLDYCVAAKSNSNYWHLVFERLDLECDSSDAYDSIYYELSNEIGFENVSELNNEMEVENSTKLNKEIEHQNSKKKKQPLTSVDDSEQAATLKNRYPFERICTKVVPILIFGFTFWSFTNLTARLILFSLIIIFCSLMLFRLLRRKSLKTTMEKYNLFSNLTTIIFLTIGLFNHEIGRYAVFYVIIELIVGLMRYIFDESRGEKAMVRKEVGL
ncbi:hypothetical protein ZORO111903_09165 [Zobellia roscoffensis]|uniref:hypothetical protein n=1 Tax=Zobellia roscoffensis TaxID=2779508 RepID=UPI00188B0264|nr:hypothetical protein [Zobellia roscoffensis]